MDIHNTTEDLVITEVNSICDTLQSEEKQLGICTCSQCRQDVTCYVLNRVAPQYVVSHRGIARFDQETNHQSRADLTALVYEGIKRVSHNQRPYFEHKNLNTKAQPDIPSFIIPTIMGRVFNGLNFSPITGIKVELLQNKKLAEMKDNNWQNPYPLIQNTGGTFTFLPKPVPSEKIDVRKVFEFTIKITDSGYADLYHVFSISLISEFTHPGISLARTYKLPDLYLFPPGEERDQLFINE